ncbi:HAD family hydrolase [Geothrix fuzhouensis]|uniref:HAD family hydrolase n=1 Tax=Geothrix fuzhouensis TaxID=2966451 RepID=UPI0021486B2A|nr:HAD family phosphatase [Geothrix fuzhouensis]
MTSTSATFSGPPIRGILFDFGNVICTFDNRRILTALAPLCGQPPEVLEQLIQSSDLPATYESGAITSQEFLAGMSSLCGHTLSEDTFVPAFTDIFTPITPTFELIRRLKPRYRLGLVSNTNPWHADRVIRTTEVFPLFDAVTLSHEVRALKPDPRIFEDALAKLGLPPEACVFIDDIPAFAAAATTLGMHGITYTGPEALLADLHALGVDA